MRALAIYAVHGESFKPLLEAALDAAGLKAGASSAGAVDETFFDTFDWRLYKEGLQCRRKGETFELSSLESGAKPLSAKPKKPLRARFAKDFPPGKLRETLESVCQLRALIEVCAIRRIFSESRLLDSSEKTVAKIRCERVFSEGELRVELASFASVQPVKGYVEEAEKLCDELDARGLPRLRDDHDELRLALGAAGRSPDDYSSSFESPARPGMNCREAASAMLLQLVEAMTANVDGVVNDTDVEFLHDFRVASRRIRSVVSQMKGALPEDVAQRLKRDFASIGTLTNKLRDLDVLLLSKADCVEAVPEELRPGLESFFKDLEERRASELSKLALELSSPKRLKTLRRWKDLLECSASMPKSPSSGTPVEELAGRFIVKRLKRVRKSADRLDESSPDAEMHALRIECKKLRYLLEFFGPLFDGSTVEKLVGRLKRLQDFLGGLNDLSVQQKFLGESLSQLSLKGSRSTLAAAALGALIARLCESRRKLKGSFTKVFDKFLDRSEFDELKAVFKGKG